MQYLARGYHIGQHSIRYKIFNTLIFNLHWLGILKIITWIDIPDYIEDSTEKKPGLWWRIFNPTLGKYKISFKR